MKSASLLSSLDKIPDAGVLKAADLFSLPDGMPGDGVFDPDAPAWEWVRLIGRALEDIDAWPSAACRRSNLERELPPAVTIQGAVYLDPTVKLPPVCTIIGPAWIGAETEIRPGAFIRGNVIVGRGCMLGNACEFKNCLLMDGVDAPHFSYVGDSILGSGAHLGAGAILSNLRLDRKEVPVHTPGGRGMSGLRKLGALIGEKAEIGCNAVLQPGTIIGKRALVMPAIAFGGYLPPNHVARARSEITIFSRRD